MKIAHLTISRSRIWALHRLRECGLCAWHVGPLVFEWTYPIPGK